MNEPRSARIDPPPAADEVAAIVAALSAYLAAERAATPSLTRVERRWALAGRLASQGQHVARVPGLRTSWGNVARLAMVVG